jgi:dihydrofolate synthase/folylpolyglutamate synthase
MNYPQSIDWLNSLINYERTPAQKEVSRYLNLQRIADAATLLGDPHLEIPYIHIAGTKGKGSTAAMTESILRVSGYRTGLFTSPHLIYINERIQINGESISDDDFAITATIIYNACKDMPDKPTYFESLTLMAFIHFAKNKIDIGILETGMGGRLDSTNICKPIVTAITTLALDHTDELGNSIDKIAGEKAGIIKDGVPVICATQPSEALAVIETKCADNNTDLWLVGRDITITNDDDMLNISTPIAEYNHLYLSLNGNHQQINAAVAIGIIDRLRMKGWKFSTGSVGCGLSSTNWPGRLQQIGENPPIIIDGAHEPLSTSLLIEYLQHIYNDKELIFILGFAREKEWKNMIAQYCSIAKKIIFTAADNPRAMNPLLLQDEALKCGFPAEIARNYDDAIKIATDFATSSVICVSGSLYLAGEAIKSRN